MNVIKGMYNRCFSPVGSKVVEIGKAEAQTAGKTAAVAEKNFDAMGNGDFVLTPGRSRFYCTVDTVGGIRQVAATVEAGALLASGTATAVSKVAGAFIPFGLLITGPLVMGSVAKWTLPDAYKELKKSKEELAKVKTSGEEASAEIVKDAEEVVTIAKLGVANHWLCFGMGAAQTGAGVTAMLTPQMASVLHYKPILTGLVAKTALAAANGVLGGAYALRGAFMLARSTKAYKPVRQMEKGFKEKLNSGPQEALEFLELEEGKGPAYFERRVDSNSLEEKDENGTVLGRYTSKGFMNTEGKVVSTIEHKREYLRRVDKGIHTQLTKHRVALVIGGAMLLGGITAIFLSVMTAGTAPLVIGLVSALFFICMEYLFFVYDSTPLFDKLCNKLYRPHPALENLGETLVEPPSVRQVLSKIIAHVLGRHKDEAA